MPESNFKNTVNNLWSTFRALKRWQQIAIGVLLFSLIAGSSGSSEEGKESTLQSESTPSASPTPTPSETPSAEPTPSASTSSSPDAPIDFRFSALRDLGDIRKDLKEARAGITENGLGRYYWNVAEITFNVGQLESLVPRDEYATNWNAALAKLQLAVDQLNPDDDSLTISKAKSALDAVLNRVAPLESIAKTIAN